MHLAHRHRPQADGDEYFVWLSSLRTLTSTSVAVTEAIISSTVPRVVFNLRDLCDRYFGLPPAGRWQARLQLPVAPRVDQGTRSPRPAGEHGSRLRPARRDLIVVDFGTATTFDVVDTDGRLYRRGHRAGRQPVAEAFTWPPQHFLTSMWPGP